MSKISCPLNRTDFFTATTFLSSPSPAGPRRGWLCPKGLLLSSVKAFSSPPLPWGETDPNWKSNPGLPCGNVGDHCGLPRRWCIPRALRGEPGSSRQPQGGQRRLWGYFPWIAWRSVQLLLVFKLLHVLKAWRISCVFLARAKCGSCGRKTLVRAVRSAETFEAGFSCSSFRVPPSRGLLPFKSLGRFGADVSGRSTNLTFTAV